MALTLGTLVGYLELDARGLDRGAAAGLRTMQGLADDITRITERVSQQAGQALGQGLADGARDGAADASRAAVAGLDPMVRTAAQVGQQAGDGLGDAITTAARAAGQAAADAGGAGLGGLEAQARAAGDAAGGAIDDGLVSAARRAGDEAGEAAGEALEAELEDAAEEAGEQGGEAVAEGLTAQDAALGLAGVALGAAFIAGFGQALEKDALTAELQGQLGATSAEAERYGGIAGDLYVSTLAETFEDGTQAIRNVFQSGLVPADATNEQLESISQKVLALAKTFKLDLGMVTVAVGQMIRTGMVKDATEGLDLIGRTFQVNDARADDMLDTLKEYPVQFSSLGLDAKTSLGIMQQMLDKGAKDSDIAADALKELRIRVSDLSAEEGLTQLGIDADEMADAFAAGGPRAAAALDMMMDRLNTFPSEAERFRIAQKIMGTQSEDLVKAFMAIDPSEAAARIGDFSGTSQEQIEALTENSSARLEQFKRNLQSKVVDVIGGEVIPALMDMGKFVKGMWEGMPEAGQESIKILGAGVVVLAGVTLAFGLAGRAAAGFRTWLATVSTQAATTSTSLRILQGATGILGVALVGATALMSLFGAASSKAKTDSSTFAKSLEQDGGTIGKYTQEQAKAVLETKGLGEAAGKAGIPMSRMIEALLGVDGATEDVTARFKEYADGIKYGEIEQGKFELSLEEAQSALEAGKAELDRSQEASETFAEQTGDTTKEVEDQEKALDALSDALDALRGQFLDQREAQSAMEAAVDDLTESFKENGRTLDLGTEKGRANDSALRDMVESAYDLSEATMRQTGSQEQANAVLLTQRDRFAQVLTQMGYTKEEAARLTAEYFRIPDGVGTEVTAEVSSALSAIGNVKSSLSSVPSSKTVTININEITRKFTDFLNPMMADGGILRYYAEGAHVAQIAPAGAMRVWAEPETGGEAYIPLAPSKRQRSTEILSQVARDFGYQLAPVGGARSFADGGVAGGGSTLGAGQQTVRLELSLDRDGLIKVVRKEVKDRGGNVQAVLGAGGTR